MVSSEIWEKRRGGSEKRMNRGIKRETGVEVRGGEKREKERMKERKRTGEERGGREEGEGEKDVTTIKSDQIIACVCFLLYLVHLCQRLSPTKFACTPHVPSTHKNED